MNPAFLLFFVVMFMLDLFFSELFLNVGNINSTNITENIAMIVLLLLHPLESDGAAFIL